MDGGKPDREGIARISHRATYETEGAGIRHCENNLINVSHRIFRRLSPTYKVVSLFVDLGFKINIDSPRKIPPHSHTAPLLAQGDITTLGDILEELKQHGLTVTPTHNPGAAPTLSMNDLVPTVRPFSGSHEQDGITIDEWRIQMRMRLKQISLIEGRKIDEEFKANYILSMLFGQAFRWVQGRFIHKWPGGDPCAGYSDAQAMLEAICDMIREQIEGTVSEKTMSEKSDLGI